MEVEGGGVSMVVKDESVVSGVCTARERVK